MTNTVPEPMSRRDVWLTIALAVARDGMPAPQSLNVRDDLDAAYIDFEHGRLAEAQQWAGHLGLERDPDVTASDGRKIIVWFSNWDRRDGHLWRVGTTIPVPEPESSPLAEQVVAAIGGPVSGPVATQQPGRGAS